MFNKRFDPSMEITCSYVTLDMDFFGSRIPINWTPKEGRMELFKQFLGTLKANNIKLIISISDRWVNYDVDKFLQEMLTEILCKGENHEIEIV